MSVRIFASRATNAGRALLFKRSYVSATTDQPLKKTCLYDFHVQNGGKMVPFAGYLMPVQYANAGVLASHLHTRENSSLFDATLADIEISTVLNEDNFHRLTGKDRIAFLEKLIVADVQNLPSGKSTLSVFTNENGGIIDDTVICKHDDHIYIVSNAACAEKDLAHMRTELDKFQKSGGDVELDVITDHGLLALQGPKSAEVLQNILNQDLNDFKFMNGRFMKIKGIECHVARSGYTGEDGFEIAVPGPEATHLSEILLSNPVVRLAGLGARDSLRLEAGLCLYGHDLDDTTTPVEAGLTWTIGKRRREEGGFIGAEKILPQIKDGVARRRIGLVVEGAPARENAEILSESGETIGKVTSGGPSPSLKKNIAMGYVKSGYHEQGTDLQVKVRNRLQKANVVKMPFVPARYHK
ncbi:2612_t:CDS:2 [Paraglomus occultum]|uniref:Aminomethyltransferase n=1 Tax=Paraglomus occultum TaxID=144539 RepID=A0A9N8VUA4_9GLOM|nr:2612_t:CDS:2 [Paraglomus occultum]